MKIKGQILKVAGLSSICIDPNFQGYGFGKELMERSIIYLDQRGYDLSFLIARRAVDRFYTKFGYFGASSYQSLKKIIYLKLVLDFFSLDFWLELGFRIYRYYLCQLDII